MLHTTSARCAQLSPPTSVATTDNDDFREYLIAAIRCARIRAQLLQNEFDEIGVALKGQMVTPEVALSWLADIGGLSFVDVGGGGQ